MCSTPITGTARSRWLLLNLDRECRDTSSGLDLLGDIDGIQEALSVKSCDQRQSAVARGVGADLLTAQYHRNP